MTPHLKVISLSFRGNQWEEVSCLPRVFSFGNGRLFAVVLIQEFSLESPSELLNHKHVCVYLMLNTDSESLGSGSGLACI